ncbi:RNA-directed DNA polymerase, eukaryota, reverse transcriptase zinc-binding domain protein [Tanacetum coccineum]
MNRLSSSRNKKVPNKFKDMIHDLSNNGMTMKNMLNKDMVQSMENDVDSGKEGVGTECCVEGAEMGKEMENGGECNSSGKMDCGNNGMESQYTNVSESVTVDTTCPVTNPDEKLVANKENVVDSKENNSYVEALSKNLIESDNKLFSVPTSVNEKGEEVVIFDEELVNEGSEKWKFTVCGYFVGSSMPVYEVKYNIRRMWGKYGLRDIVVDNDEICYAKFKDEESMNLVLEQSPWMVNGRPFIVQKWDPQVTIVKSAPCKIPVWIKLFNVPLEAWSIKGISTLSSRLGRPIIMDKVTADMCNRGIGWLGYARVLVEIEAGKALV